MPKGPPRETYEKMTCIRPDDTDFQLYRRFLDLLENSEQIKTLKTKPQYIAVRADSDVPPIAGIMGGSDEKVGVYHPTLQVPAFFLNYAGKNKPAITISDPDKLLNVQVLHLDPNDGNANKTWSNVSTHPEKYNELWTNLIKQ